MNFVLQVKKYGLIFNVFMITSNISNAVDALNQGDLVAIPTETVYGLAGSAFNDHAIDKIFKLKNRPTCNPLILHTHSIEEVLKFVQQVPPAAMKLRVLRQISRSVSL